MVDGGGLENHCTGNRAGGSNPSPSAILRENALSEVEGLPLAKAGHPALDMSFV